MSEPMTDLNDMLRSLDVVARPEPYVVVTTHRDSDLRSTAAATIDEAEGLTLVLPEELARSHGIDIGTRFAWLTLTIHSSLEAVGLTAAFSAALADAGISCNVLAGFHHDHLLVPLAESDRAVAVLRSLRR